MRWVVSTSLWLRGKTAFRMRRHGRGTGQAAAGIGLGEKVLGFLLDDSDGVGAGRKPQRRPSYAPAGRERPQAPQAPVGGQLALDVEALELPSEPGLQLNVYTAAAGTPTSDALTLLAAWAAS
jgi:MmyB-like transcription regulator ligand binding domain